MSILDKNIYFCVLKAETWSSVKEPTKAIGQKQKQKSECPLQSPAYVCNSEKIMDFFPKRKRL